MGMEEGRVRERQWSQLVSECMCVCVCREVCVFSCPAVCLTINRPLIML